MDESKITALKDLYKDTKEHFDYLYATQSRNIDIMREKLKSSLLGVNKLTKEMHERDVALKKVPNNVKELINNL